MDLTNNASAAEDPAVLLKIAKRAQEQINNQISNDSSDKVKRLFEEGTQQVDVLEKALRNDDVSSAKEYFLSAMKIFKEISRHLISSNNVSDVAPQAESSSIRDTVRDPSNDSVLFKSLCRQPKNILQKSTMHQFIFLLRIIHCFESNHFLQVYTLFSANV